MKAIEYISQSCLKTIKSAVAETGGMEVFFVGRIENNTVKEVIVAARGNETAVPAVTRLAGPGDVVIHNHPSGALAPSQADLDIACVLAADNIGFYIIDNQAEEIYPVTEPVSDDLCEVEYQTVKEILDENGPLSQEIENYEPREGQLLMAQDVCEALNKHKIAVIEAGCGIGKSMAYLVPAALFAVQNKKRVIISTRTINLQDQLTNKDVPLLEKIAGVSVKTAVLKGRANYACPRRTAEAVGDAELFDDPADKETLTAIWKWIQTSEHGTVSELPLEIDEHTWDRVSSDPDLCSAPDCRHYNMCPYWKARRRAVSAHIVVVNHSLLFSDTALKRAAGNMAVAGILPDYSAVVLDEAHHVEDTAGAHLGLKADSKAVTRLISRLVHPKKKKGLLIKAAKIRGDRFAKTRDMAASAVETARTTAMTLAEKWRTAAKTAGAMTREKNSSNGGTLRITEEVAGSLLYNELASTLREATRVIGVLVSSLAGLCKEMESQLQEEDDISSLHRELEVTISRLGAVQSSLAEFTAPQDEDFVYWIKYNEKSGSLSTLMTPINVGPMLKKLIYDRLKTTVMCSATLAVGKDLSFYKKRVGLDTVPSTRLIEECIESPFPYEKNVLLAVPIDLPDPRDNNYTERTADFITSALQIVEGGAFVLFTSFSMLNEIYDRVAKSDVCKGLYILRQGDMPRHALLEEFKRGRNKVLFATDSFWEGVDVAGDSLRCVIIARLPFAVPTDPVMSARAEYLEKRGMSPFNDYFLPMAALKLKQGYGRLIRRATDKGSVIVCDNRLITRSYGKKLLRALPKSAEIFDVSGKVLEELRTFHG